ncbi:MAG: hypothetical protein OXC63_03550, partial [Aestuariivita sp.]|nr:hypothetical protein [Aestuariivita sp.]
ARPRRATLNGNIMMLALALACFDRFKKFEIILAICSYGAILNTWSSNGTRRGERPIKHRKARRKLRIRQGYLRLSSADRFQFEPRIW